MACHFKSSDELGRVQVPMCQESVPREPNRLPLYSPQGGLNECIEAVAWSLILQLPGRLPARGDLNTPDPILIHEDLGPYHQVHCCYTRATTHWLGSGHFALPGPQTQDFAFYSIQYMCMRSTLCLGIFFKTD